jgi:hypothetical protein
VAAANTADTRAIVPNRLTLQRTNSIRTLAGARLDSVACLR